MYKFIVLLHMHIANKNKLALVFNKETGHLFFAYYLLEYMLMMEPLLSTYIIYSRLLFLSFHKIIPSSIVKFQRYYPMKKGCYHGSTEINMYIIYIYIQYIKYNYTCTLYIYKIIKHYILINYIIVTIKHYSI